MIKEEAERLAQRLKIDITQVVREEWELKILKILADFPVSQKMYFKGGTTLRLAFDSPRFSEDLDFTMTKSITEVELKEFADAVTKTYQESEISDLRKKYYNFLVEFKIKESFLSQNFRIKIEISKRKTVKRETQLILLNSPVTDIQVLLPVEKIEEIYQEKLNAMAERKKPRDLFDIWFITQKLRKPMPKKLTKINKKELRRDLAKFLPSDYRPVLLELEKNYGL